MTVLNKVESPRKVEDAIYSEIILSGEGWTYELKPGQVLRIIDLEGNQAVDVLFYDADNREDHFSAVATMEEEGRIYATTGSTLLAESGKELVTIVADTVGYHDLWFGYCSAQSNTVRYGHDKLHNQSCRDTYLLQMAQNNYGLTKRDLPPNINFFTKVPLTPEGGITFVDGISPPGSYVEIQAQCRTLVLMSICSQLLNPCNDYNPTPVQLYIWDN
jgi:urea carboxylase-associated protein 1